MGLLQAGGGACARWGGSVTSYVAYGMEHVWGLPIADPHRMPFLVRYFIDTGLGHLTQGLIFIWDYAP
eukprot:SAG25_NODE_658_length_6112_cov_137.492932_8_plen_68_part_00